jgi:signal transduction histidine kinase
VAAGADADAGAAAGAGGLDRLGALTDAVRAAGAPVTVAVEGAGPALPAAVDHCAYRILQESLTNVLRHAGPAASVGIVLRYRPGALDIEVTDDGAGAPAPGGPAGDSGGPDAAGGGHGLTGMAERVSALGGTVRARPRPGGGFEVVAQLPFGAAAEPAAGNR